ncbi:MAG: extracellular solute-binding protein [Clostridia bacterium]|nr:extracellular solute-binding protein [Clostridia bacterium]
MKRLLTLLLAALLCCLPVSCTHMDSPADTPSDEIKADAMKDPYGVSAEEAVILQDSGEVVLYWDTLERSAREEDFADYFEKYYGGTVTVRFCPPDDDAVTLTRDQAAGMAPDLFRLTESYWPRAALRGLTMPRSQLTKLGVVGLDHPVLTQYRGMTEAAYTYGGDCFAVSVCSVSPVMVAFNAEMFRGYAVASPADYYVEGEWNNTAFLRCCNELSRTDPNGHTVLGAVPGDLTWFLRAADADPMTIRGTTLTVDLLSSNALQALSFCRTLLQSSAVGTDEEAFLSGRAGMLCATAEDLIPRLSRCAFEWDVVPFPYGDGNETGARPGTFVGWAVPYGAKNVQGAVNFVIARQLFLNFHYGVEQGALWNAGYGVYSEAQRRRILDATAMVRPALFPDFGDLPARTEAFWTDVGGSEPIYDVASRYTDVIRAAITEEMTATQQGVSP